MQKNKQTSQIFLKRQYTGFLFYF